MTETTQATVRLRPKTDARRIRFGYPWVYDNELVTDRRTKSLTAGTTAVLQDENREPLGLVAVTPGSKIIGRMLDTNPEAQIDEAWFVDRLIRALDLRTRFFDQPYYRLVHAEADRLPGVIIDRFGDTCVIQPNAAWADARIDLLVAALIRVTGVSNVVINGAGRARKLEGLDDAVTVHTGTVDGPIPVQMNGATYMADVLGGQKTGLFFDQRPNHAFGAKMGQGGSVLDVFSHVGGFSLAALAGGATSALAIDGSQPALDLALAGAEAQGVADRFSVRRGDAFAAMTALSEEGAKFDLVVCDPPAFAPGKSALEAGLRAYEKVARLGTSLVAPGGYLVLCSCSHAATPEKFRTVSIRGIGRAGRTCQLLHSGAAGPDHPQHPMLAESGYLKSLFFRLD